MSWTYRRVYSRLWDDERFRSLSERGQRVALYLLTGSQGNGIGFFRFSPGKAAEDLGWTARMFDRAFAEVLSVMEWRFDSVARVVLLPKFFKYNAPDNPNCLKAWLKELTDLPASTLFEEFTHAELVFSESLRLVFCGAIEAFRAERSGEPSGEGLGKRLGEGSMERRGEPSAPPNTKTKPTPKPKTTPKTPPAVCEAFETTFWNSYPTRNGRKIGKPAALRNWQRLTEEDRRDLLPIAVKHYAASPDVQRGIGVKDPARWLFSGKNEEPWREWIEPASATTGSLPRNGFEDTDYHKGVNTWRTSNIT